jgi:hypothetical protein
MAVDTNFRDYERALKLKQEFASDEREDVLEFADKIITYLGYGIIALISYNLLKE